MFGIAFNCYAIFDSEFAKYYEYIAGEVDNLALTFNGEVACHPNVDGAVSIVEVCNNIITVDFISVKINCDLLLNLKSFSENYVSDKNDGVAILCLFNCIGKVGKSIVIIAVCNVCYMSSDIISRTINCDNATYCTIVSLYGIIFDIKGYICCSDLTVYSVLVKSECAVAFTIILVNAVESGLTVTSAPAAPTFTTLRPVRVESLTVTTAFFAEEATFTV